MPSAFGNCYNFSIFNSNTKQWLMAIDEQLTNRVRELIAPFSENVEEKKMFGGICFMVNDKMCVGVKTEHLMVRINPAKQEEALSKEGCKPTVMKGKTMEGFVWVDPYTITTKTKLNYWIKLALEYNTIAKSSKKKKK